MQTKELIKKLQTLVDKHDSLGMQEMLGEHEISMDVFEKSRCEWAYRGITPDLDITYSGDGVYCILGPKGMMQW